MPRAQGVLSYPIWSSARWSSSATGSPCGQAACGGGEVGGGDVAGLGREGLVQLAGALALAVDLVVAEVAEDVGDGDAAGRRLAVLAAAVAVEVRGRQPVLFQQLLVARARAWDVAAAAMFSRSWSRLVISLTTACIRWSAKMVLMAACSFLKPLSTNSLNLGAASISRNCRRLPATSSPPGRGWP